MSTPTKKPKRIYRIRSKNGKKVIFVSARSLNQALRWVMTEYFIAAVATHEELLEHWETDTPEIIDVSEPIQADIEDDPEPEERDPESPEQAPPRGAGENLNV